jgi:hypothetical protein
MLIQYWKYLYNVLVDHWVSGVNKLSGNLSSQYGFKVKILVLNRKLFNTLCIRVFLEKNHLAHYLVIVDNRVKDDTILFKLENKKTVGKLIIT